MGDFGGCHNRPSEAHCFGFAVSKLRSAMPRLHGVFHDMPSPMAALAGVTGGWAWQVLPVGGIEGRAQIIAPLQRGVDWTGCGFGEAMGLVFYDVIALGGEVFFCAGF